MIRVPGKAPALWRFEFLTRKVVGFCPLEELLSPRSDRRNSAERGESLCPGPLLCDGEKQSGRGRQRVTLQGLEYVECSQRHVTGQLSVRQKAHTHTVRTRNHTCARLTLLAALLSTFFLCFFLLSLLLFLFAVPFRKKNKQN